MDLGLTRIYEKFVIDMQRQGIFVGPTKKNLWEEPSYFYEIKVGGNRYLVPDVQDGSVIHEKGNVLRDEEGYLNDDSTSPICTVSFKKEGQQGIAIPKDQYHLIIPGKLDKPVVSRENMARGIHLLSILDSWAFINGRLDRHTLPSTRGGDRFIEKDFILDETLIEK